MKQRTEEWRQAKVGKVSASRIADVMSSGAGRKNYLAQLVVERLTGQPTESYCSAAMQWGIDNEAAARFAYECATGNRVREVGFIDHPIIENSGASPDGEVDLHGLVEIKCPNTATHIDYILTGDVDKKYLFQMQWQMDTCDGAWCDFVSFDPRIQDENLQLYIKRIDYDAELVKTIRAEVIRFLAEVEDTIKRLKAVKGVK